MKKQHVVIVGHGPLPEALKASAEMIAGDLPNVETVGLNAGEEPTHYRDRVLQALGENSDVLILSDLRGGTPDNVAAAIARRREKTWVVNGASLALVLEAAMGDVELSVRGLQDLAEVSAAVLTFAPST